MIPKYPKFKKLEVSDKSEFDTLLRNFPPYSDHNFAGLFTYNVEDEVEVSNLNNNLIVKNNDYITRETLISYSGVHNPLNTIDTLFEYCEKKGFAQRLKLIPEENFINVLDQLNEKYNIQADRDNFDYIIPIDNMIIMAGNALYKEKNLVHQFIRNYPNTEVRELNLQDATMQKEIINLFNLWESKKNLSDKDTQVELEATKRAIKFSKILSFKSIGIYIENKLIAYSINELLKHNLYMGHFGKADASYKGVYQYIEHVTAKHMKSLGCEFMNNEQDLGEPGLRMSKSAWGPTSFLKKYTISKKL